jgi:hypothetical protein
MNNYAKHIGLPAKPIEAGGETYQPREIKAILQELARLGINEDKLIAQINPREAAILKRLGGSGKINPATGLMSFDEGGEGGSGNDSGNEAGGGWGGGWGGSELGASGGEMGGANWSGEAPGGDPTGGDPTGGGPTDGSQNESYLDEYGRDVRDVYGAEYIGDRSNVTGSPGDLETGANIFSKETEDELDPDVPAGEAMEGTLAGQVTVNAIMNSVVDWLLSGRQAAEATADDVQGGFQGKSSPSAYAAAALAAEDAARDAENNAQAAAAANQSTFGNLADVGQSSWDTGKVSMGYGLTGVTGAGTPGLGTGDYGVSTASNSQTDSTTNDDGSTTEARSDDTGATTQTQTTSDAPTTETTSSVTDQPSVAAVIEDLARQDARPDGLDQNVFMPDMAAAVPGVDLVTLISNAAEKAAEEKKQQDLVADAIRRQRNYLLGQQNYANGGLVDPTRPTQAFTDGAFTPGYVSAPPALTGYESFGSDNYHASPLAPAPAASVPMLSMGYPMSMYMNKNAGPVASPVPQNPNVAASVGPGPLSQLG